MQEQTELLNVSDEQHKANVDMVRTEFLLLRAEPWDMPEITTIDPVPYFIRFEKRRRK